MSQVFDVAIIGGGINGCGCAADAALRGLSVILFEQDDLASKTSSSSTKLIHGGLRYLEYYEFKLVKKALEERQRLLDLAPYLVKPLSLVLPYQKNMRPAWMIRLGLFFYDNLSRKNRLPKSISIRRLTKSLYFTALKKQFTRGFLFHDGYTDDARLTIVNALQAQKYGASINTYSRIIKTEIVNNLWQLTIQPKVGSPYQVQAKVLINAAGPWIDKVNLLTHIPTQQRITLVKGSHILVPKMYEGEHAYLLQHDDSRIIFIIPYHGYHMIGTTDVAYEGTLENIEISLQEQRYLLNLVNDYFQNTLTEKDIFHTWSGVRPLLASEDKELKALSRDYHYEFIRSPAPAITIFGGKITTYRQLAEEIINHLTTIFPKMPESCTKTTPLPGADSDQMNFNEYMHYAHSKYFWLDKRILDRYLQNYGSLTEHLLAKHTNNKSLGIHFGATLYQAELDYLIKYEWVKECDDALRRRTKLFLDLDEKAIEQVKHYISSHNTHKSVGTLDTV